MLRGLPLVLSLRQTYAILAQTQKIREISQRMFREQGAAGHFVEDESQLGSALATYCKPDVILFPRVIANAGAQTRRVLAKFRQAAKYAEGWNPFTGTVTPVASVDKIEIALAPYESRLIFFTN